MSSIALFNDTGNLPHVGCLAVSRAHETMLAARGVQIGYRAWHDQFHELWQGSEEASCRAVRESEVLEAIRANDAVVVNGEGTLHHGLGSNLLAILHVAQKEGKPTFLVNALIEDCFTFPHTLAGLTGCTVRDARSAAELADRGVTHRLVPDSILECPFSEQSSQDLSGRIVVTDWHPSRDADVGDSLRKLLDRLGPKAVFYPLDHPDRQADWEHTVANFATARAVVTARHHGVYLAVLARVPFLALPSNSHKVEGLLEMASDPLPLAKLGFGQRQQLRQLLRRPEPSLAFGATLLSHRPLDTFAELFACLSPSASV